MWKDFKNLERETLSTELEEYAWDRQVRVWGIGVKGQLRLEGSKILIAGIGAVGTNICETLVRMNVAESGKLTLIDKDKVANSNISRYGLLTFEDVGRSKVESVVEKLENLNDQFALEKNLFPINKDIYEIPSDALEKIIEEVDVVVLAFDSFPPRLRLAEICFGKKRPYIYVGIDSMNLAVQTCMPTEATPCIGCNPYIIKRTAQGETDNPCLKDPNIAPVARMAADVTIIEILKILCPTIGKPIKHLLLYNARFNAFSVLKLTKKEDCEICGSGKKIMLEKMQESFKRLKEITKRTE